MQKTYSTGEMIEFLEIGQLAIQVSGGQHETDTHVATPNGSALYYDSEDMLLKCTENNRPIAIFKSNKGLFKWVIVDESK